MQHKDTCGIELGRTKLSQLLVLVVNAWHYGRFNSNFNANICRCVSMCQLPASRMNSNTAHSLQGSCERSSWCSHFSCRGSSWKSSWCSKCSRRSCSWCSFGGLFSCWRSCYSSFICQGAEVVMSPHHHPQTTNEHSKQLALSGACCAGLGTLCLLQPHDLTVRWPPLDPIACVPCCR